MPVVGVSYNEDAEKHQEDVNGKGMVDKILVLARMHRSGSSA